jgi:hypothetical protein
MAKLAPVDVLVSNHGTIFLFELKTTAAKEWVSEKVGGEVSYFCGSLVVEHRFALDLAEGMRNDGLVVQ